MQVDRTSNHSPSLCCESMDSSLCRCVSVPLVMGGKIGRDFDSEVLICSNWYCCRSCNSCCRWSSIISRSRSIIDSSSSKWRSLISSFLICSSTTCATNDLILRSSIEAKYYENNIRKSLRRCTNVLSLWPKQRLARWRLQLWYPFRWFLLLIIS